MHPLQASHVLSTYMDLQSAVLLSLSGLSLQGPCAPLLYHSPHMDCRGPEAASIGPL